MKLYKFRPLADDDDCDRLKKILKTGEFHCSRFSELNDPMEGVYHFLNYAPEKANIIKSVFDEKSCYKICSFSHEKAFSNPIMWGYYANGFRGAVVEIDVSEKEINKIEYLPEILSIDAENPKEDVIKILTTKLLPWNHEDEYRFLVQNENDKDKFIIGKIIGIYFGDPYEITLNKNKIIENNWKLKEYHRFKDDIINSIKDIDTYSVKVENREVIKIKLAE